MSSKRSSSVHLPKQVREAKSDVGREYDGSMTMSVVLDRLEKAFQAVSRSGMGWLAGCARATYVLDAVPAQMHAARAARESELVASPSLLLSDVMRGGTALSCTHSASCDREDLFSLICSFHFLPPFPRRAFTHEPEPHSKRVSVSDVCN